MATELLNIVVLISGNGSNLQAIIDAIAINHLHITINAVISNNPDAYGLIRARQNHIPCEICLANSKTSYDTNLLNCIKPYHPELIVLAGFMKILGKTFL